MFPGTLTNHALLMVVWREHSSVEANVRVVARKDDLAGFLTGATAIMKSDLVREAWASLPERNMAMASGLSVETMHIHALSRTHVSLFRGRIEDMYRSTLRNYEIIQ